MKQPFSRDLTSHSINTSFHSRVAQRMYALVGFRDEEATSMPARFDLTLMPKKNSGLAKFLGFFLAVLFFFVANSPAQTAAHSPGWVVLPVDEYRTLHARAYPTEREPEPPPVEATLTRVDYDLRINGDLASGLTRASVQIPRQGVDVRLAGGLLSEKSESAAESKWIAYGRGNEVLTFTWRRKTEDHRATQPLRLRGSLTQLLGLGEDSTSINAAVNLEVTQGAAHEVKIQIPDLVTINQVLGAMVADWVVKDNELSITFLEPVEQQARFVITGETRTSRERQIDIPLLRLLNAERETGGVAVEVLGAGEIKDAKSEGLESADATDLGEMVASRQSQSLNAFRFRPGPTKLARSLRVDVARYTPQAVLMANVEEARYQVLITGEGKVLVQARYAIRNNQRNFLKVTLPAGATLWTASLAGRAVRPGQAPDGSLLLPLDKARSGEEAPEFAVEIVYLARGSAWNDKGQFKLSLPALDLPVSHTGLLVYHPPLFKVTPEPGTFRIVAYVNPSSAALNPHMPLSSPIGGAGGGKRGGIVAGVGSDVAMLEMAPSAPVPEPDLDFKDETKSKQAKAATMSLLDKFRADALAGKRAGILPIRVSFPAFGPSLFLVSELTAENQSPSAEITFQRDKKAGGK